MISITEFNSLRQKLSEPLVLYWVLDRLQDKKDVSKTEAEKLERELFDEPALRRLIDSGQLFTELIGEVSPERFAGVAGMMADKWPGWSGEKAQRSAKIIARFAPGKAYAIFLDFLDIDDIFEDLKKFSGLYRAVPLLDRERALELAERLMDMTEISLIDEDETIVGDIFYMLDAFHLPQKQEFFKELIETYLKEDDDEESLVNLYRGICPFSSYYEQIMVSLENRSRWTFAGLEPLFRERAPLGEMDQMIRKQVHDLDRALNLLRGSGAAEAHSAADLVLSVFPGLARGIDKKARRMLVRFTLAVAAETFRAEEPNWSSLPLERIFKLVRINMSVLPAKEELLAHLESLPRETVMAEIKKAASASIDQLETIHLIKLIGELPWPELIPLNIDWLGEPKNDLFFLILQQNLIRIGEPAQKEILNRWDELSEDQKHHGLWVISRIGREAAVDHLLKLFPEMRAQDINYWCMCAEAVPDPRFIELLQPELRRKQLQVNKTFAICCLLLDRDYRHLRTLIREIQEQWEDVSDSLDYALAGGPPPDTIEVELKCPLCGDNNAYELERVLLNMLPGSQDIYIPEEPPCLSCGQKAEMMPTEIGSAAVMLEALRISSAMKSGHEFESPLQLVLASK